MKEYNEGFDAALKGFGTENNPYESDWHYFEHNKWCEGHNEFMEISRLPLGEVY